MELLPIQCKMAKDGYIHYYYTNPLCLFNSLGAVDFATFLSGGKPIDTPMKHPPPTPSSKRRKRRVEERMELQPLNQGVKEREGEFHTQSPLLALRETRALN